MQPFAISPKEIGKLRVGKIICRKDLADDSDILYTYLNWEYPQDEIRKIISFNPPEFQRRNLKLEKSSSGRSIDTFPWFCPNGIVYISGQYIRNIKNCRKILELGVSAKSSHYDSRKPYTTILTSADGLWAYGIPHSGRHPLSHVHRIDRWRIGAAIRENQKIVNCLSEDELKIEDPYHVNPFHLAISPDNRHIASVCFNERSTVFSNLVLCQWNVTNDSYHVYVIPDEQQSIIHGISYSPDSQWIVMAGLEIGILGREDSRAEGVIKSGEVRSFDITQDSRSLLTVNNDHQLVQWAIPSGEKIREYDFSKLIGPVECVAVSPDGFTAYAAGTQGRFLRWDLE